ncbi:MAG: family 16 glycosylhydrolase [Clostridia bacterium]|nr:family 16 glycosylhydrolase [Clostridia bacterium]
MGPLAYRQQESWNRFVRILKEVFSGNFKRFAVLGLVLAEALGCIIFDTPLTPVGDELDLTGYELVFEEEFDGDSLNPEKVKIRREGPTRGGFDSASQVSFRDGNLVITGEYLEDGKFGPGWYSAQVILTERYKQGYFECRCICNADPGMWSAFWIQASHPYEAAYSQGGVGGAELDIMESKYESKYNNYITNAIHCAGVDGVQEGFQSRLLGCFKGNNVCKEYNTYGLKWTEDEYIFYVNGVESCRSTFGNGVSQVEEDVIINLCIPDADVLAGLDKEIYKTEFIVDYVRIYQ